VDFKWIKPGVPVVAPAPVPSGPSTPDAPPPPLITGVIVPPATDITLRTVHSTWQGGIASTVVVEFLPLLGVHLSPKFQTVLIALLTGALALGRSWLSHRKQAKALPA
jgi:hypothetical protein